MLLINTGKIASVAEGDALGIGMFPVQTTLGARLGIGPQPCCKVLGDPQIKLYNEMNNIPVRETVSP